MKNLKKILVLSLFLIGFIGMAQNPHADSGLKKVIVQEVLQVESYTYLNVLEDGTKKWLAVPRREAKLGEIYYYKGGMEMRDFKSTELDRTFDVIFFLGSITSADAIDPAKGMKDPNAEPEKPAKPAIQTRPVSWSASVGDPNRKTVCSINFSLFQIF